MGFMRVFVLILFTFFGALVVSALSVGYATWIPYALFLGLVSIVVWKKSKPRDTSDKTVSRERSEEALEDYVKVQKHEE